MGQITLNYDDAKRVLDNPDASPDAQLIAASTIAFFKAKELADEVSGETRSIALKLSHMVAAEMYGTSVPAREVD